MKTAWMPVFLTAVLSVMALISFVQGARFFFMMRQLQGARSDLASMELLQIALRNLTEECVGYSQTNPTLTPLLQQFDVRGVKPASNPPRSTGR
jgi:hypothetical protein